MMKIQAAQQEGQARLQHDQQVAAQQAQMEQMREQAIAQREEQQAQREHAREMEKTASAERCSQHDAMIQQDTELKKVALQVAGQIEVAKINAGVKAAADAANAQIEGERVAGEQEAAKGESDRASNEGADARKIMEELLKSQSKILETIAKPKTIERDAEGRALRVVTG